MHALAAGASQPATELTIRRHPLDKSPQLADPERMDSEAILEAITEGDTLNAPDSAFEPSHTTTQEHSELPLHAGSSPGSASSACDVSGAREAILLPKDSAQSLHHLGSLTPTAKDYPLSRTLLHRDSSEAPAQGRVLAQEDQEVTDEKEVLLKQHYGDYGDKGYRVKDPGSAWEESGSARLPFEVGAAQANEQEVYREAEAVQHPSANKKALDTVWYRDREVLSRLNGSADCGLRQNAWMIFHMCGHVHVKFVSACIVTMHLLPVQMPLSVLPSRYDVCTLASRACTCSPPGQCTIASHGSNPSAM